MSWVINTICIFGSSIFTSMSCEDIKLYSWIFFKNFQKIAILLVTILSLTFSFFLVSYKAHISILLSFCFFLVFLYLYCWMILCFRYQIKLVVILHNKLIHSLIINLHAKRKISYCLRICLGSIYFLTKVIYLLWR